MTAHESKAREILEKIDSDRLRSDIHPAQARDEHIGAIANALAEATEREREACAVMLEAVAGRIDNTDAFTELAKKNLNSAVAAIRARSAIRGRNSTDG